MSKDELFELAAIMEKPIFHLDNLDRLHLRLHLVNELALTFDIWLFASFTFIFE